MEGAFVRRLDPAGAPLWTVFFTDDHAGYPNTPAAIALDPDFIVALGNERADEAPRIACGPARYRRSGGTR